MKNDNYQGHRCTRNVWRNFVCQNKYVVWKNTSPKLYFAGQCRTGFTIDTFFIMVT
eukprot:UN14153